MIDRFICAGSLNVDLTFPVERLPAEHEKLRCRGSALHYGGSAANTAYWLARLEQPVQMLGCVGDDPFGSLAVAALAEVGVDTRLIQRTCRNASGRHSGRRRSGGTVRRVRLSRVPGKRGRPNRRGRRLRRRVSIRSRARGRAGDVSATRPGSRCTGNRAPGKSPAIGRCNRSPCARDAGKLNIAPVCGCPAETWSRAIPLPSDANRRGTGKYLSLIHI